MIDLGKKGLLFLLVLLIQLFFIDQIDLGFLNYYFSPLIYGLVVIIIYPAFDFSYLLIAAFFMGCSIDLFRNTLGLNISSLVAVAYFRKYILSLISPRDGFEPNKDLNIFNIGVGRFILYASIMLFFHHFWFYVLEDFHFNQLHILIFRAISNSIIALMFLLLIQYLTFRNK